jgi:hypothetical protein
MAKNMTNRFLCAAITIFLLLAAKFYKPPKDQKETNIPPPNVINDNENLKNTKELTKL